MAKATKTEASAQSCCPACGYCPHCGRRDIAPYPYRPIPFPVEPYPARPYPPYWYREGPQEVTCGGGAATTPEHLRGSIAYC